MDIGKIIDIIVGFFSEYFIPNAGKIAAAVLIVMAALFLLRLILPALWENFLLFIVKKFDEHNNRKE